MTSTSINNIRRSSNMALFLIKNKKAATQAGKKAVQSSGKAGAIMRQQATQTQRLARSAEFCTALATL